MKRAPGTSFGLAVGSRWAVRARWVTRAVVGAIALAGLALVVGSVPVGSVPVGSVLVGSATAQRRRREPPPPPPVPYDAVVQWTVFVSAYGDQPARRTVATAEAGSIAIPMEGWQCTCSTPNRAQLNETNWSEVRTLECTHGEAMVSTTGFCQIAGPSWGARAGVLSLGSRGNANRVQVTLDCSVVE